MQIPLNYLFRDCNIFYRVEQENPIFAEAPGFVELEITYTEPDLRGDTATNTLNQATLETSAIVNVPLFINQGEKIKVDTRTITYVERVK